jgi:hypothetical protein
LGAWEIATIALLLLAFAAASGRAVGHHARDLLHVGGL